MLGSVYTGMSGLASFSKGLDVLSQNVANVNTAGYKSSDLVFEDVFYGYSYADSSGRDFSGGQYGEGVTADTTTIRFNQGEFRDTGNDTDVAIDGNGFFVLENRGDYYYTRAGQFDFSDDGYLVTRDGGSKVMGINPSGQLVNINISDFRTTPAIATSEVTFVGNLSTGASEHVVSEVEVHDAVGNKSTLSIAFNNNSAVTPRSWLLQIRDADGNIIDTGGEIRFQGNGSPAEGFNQYSFTYSPADSEPLTLTLDFGEPGSFTAATSFSSGASSDLAFDTQNGNARGSLLSIDVDTEGRFFAKYTNEVSTQFAQLALAQFLNQQGLETLGSGLFKALPGTSAEYSAATVGGAGSILQGKVELSNVELSQQFTDLVVIQRGYQASSQVLTVANEMAQQLIEAIK